MPHERHHPDGLFPSAQYGFSQAVSASGARQIFCAGQTAWDTEQNIVGPGDFRAQMRKTLENVGTALAAAGAGPEHATSLRIFVADYELDFLPIIGEELTAFFGDNLPANSVIGVAKLALPEFMVEIEAFAVAD